ncbi:uncharacterized protein TNCV_2499681 [Trichonephila clavipes]|nr:uncharacterized protein TNCV_2499681 [Trichonephila clavipes]
MYAFSSSVNPTPLAHADTQRDGHPRSHNVEVRNPQNRVQLLEFLAKFEERYSCKAIRGSRNSDDVKRGGWNERRMFNVNDNRRNWRNSEDVRRPSNGRNNFRGNYGNDSQGNQWFESRNRFQIDCI